MNQPRWPFGFVLASTVTRLRSLLANVAGLLAIDPTNIYRPEAHYMRGPGPKWRAKQTAAGQR
jgi:hypothetical protein